jgi:hypothetical protein
MCSDPRYDRFSTLEKKRLAACPRICRVLARVLPSTINGGIGLEVCCDLDKEAAGVYIACLLLIQSKVTLELMASCWVRSLDHEPHVRQ